MPRVTKAQKEQGKAPKPKAKPAPYPKSKPLSGGSKLRDSERDGQDGKERKKGFQVGPAHASRNAYLGKAKKIKTDLIQRAKMKKSFAKVLKAEGLESDRLRSKEERSMKPIERRKVSRVEKDDNEEEDPEPSIEITDRNPRSAGPSSPPTQKRPRPSVRDAATSWKGKSRTNDSHSSNPLPTTAAKPVRALSPIELGQVMPLNSFRDLKKEAFSKYHKPRISDTRVPSKGATGGRGPGGMHGKSRGQPNMAARMGVLLEQIKRDKS